MTNIERRLTVKNQYISRRFDDATFVFDPTSQSSLFVEGTLADLVPVLMEDQGFPVPPGYLHKIPQPDREKAKGDIELVRKAVRSFLDATQSKHLPQKDTSAQPDPKESAMQRLSAYAVKNWQIINASIEVTYHCNLRCEWCYLDDYTGAGPQREQLQAIADQLLEVGAVFVLFTGGEPFSRKDIFDIMVDFQSRGFVLEAKSNGLLLNRSTIKKLASLNLLNLQVSVYDVESRYSPLMGRYYQFDRLADNIKAAVAEDIPISLAVLVGKHNVDSLEQYHEVLQGLGVKEIFYSPYITPRRNGTVDGTRFRLSREEMNEKLYPFFEKISGFIEPREYRRRCRGGPACFAGRDQIAIDPQGVVFPCLDFRIPLGNILQDGLGHILKQRRRLLKPYTLEKIKKCWRCPIAKYCDSCVGTALLENGVFTKPSQHKCDITNFYFDADKRRKEVIK